MPPPTHCFPATRLSFLIAPFLFAVAAPALRAEPPPGSVRVLDVGKIHLRVTNQGYLGRIEGPIYPAITGQWPGASGVEYLTSIQLAVAARNPEASDPANVRRVSRGVEWQPATTGPEDSIRTAYEGIPGGLREVDDDEDGWTDEDFLDGRDNDLDGLIDEDYAALGSRMLSYTMRDDTPAAIDGPAGERHVPFGLHCAQRAWAYSHPGFTDFVVVESILRNVSGHTLDSVYIGWRVNLGCGAKSGWGDPGLGDLLVPTLPSAVLPLVLDADDPRRQHPWDPVLGIALSPDSALCPRMNIPVRGFSVVDADGDGGLATGVASFLLLDHTLDPSGVSAPSRIGFRSFRSAAMTTPFEAGGLPVLDIDTYNVMSGVEDVDPQTGSPTGAPSDAPDDYVVLCSIGPYMNVGAGSEMRATIAFAVQPGTSTGSVTYEADRGQFLAGQLGARELFRRHPALENAFRLTTVQLGNIVSAPPGIAAPDRHGREYSRIAPPGIQYELADCHDVAMGVSRVVTSSRPTWFDFDCDYCSGVYDYPAGTGLLHRRWALPPSLLVDAGDSDRPRAPRAHAFPNPSAGSVRVAFEAVPTEEISIDVTDVAGRRVRRLKHQVVAPGQVIVMWDGRDDGGRRAGAGIYFIRAVGEAALPGTTVVLLD